MYRYFIFNAYVPIISKSINLEVAGKFGLVIAIFSMFLSLSLSWVFAKTPKMGMLAGSEKKHEMLKVWKKSSLKGLFLLISFMFIGVISPASFSSKPWCSVMKSSILTRCTWADSKAVQNKPSEMNKEKTLNFIIIDVFKFHKYSKYQNELPKTLTLIGQKTEEIIPVCINNQSQQQEKPYHLGILHKLIIGLSSADHFI